VSLKSHFTVVDDINALFFRFLLLVSTGVLSSHPPIQFRPFASSTTTSMRNRFIINWNGPYSKASNAAVLRHAAFRLRRHYKIKRLDQHHISVLDVKVWTLFLPFLWRLLKK
jgi:hypothetical protein